MTVSVQQSVVLYQLCMSIPVSHIRKEEHDYTHYFVPTIALESYCHGVQSLSELGQSFQHCVLELAATLRRLVGALILRRLQGGSLIHGCFCTKGTKGPWPSGSVPDKRLMWDSVQACALWVFPVSLWRRMARTRKKAKVSGATGGFYNNLYALLLVLNFPCIWSRGLKLEINIPPQQILAKSKGDLQLKGV